MNRRQKKKAYKKKYGYNPPKTVVQYHYKEWGRIMAGAMTRINAAIQRVAIAASELSSEIREMTTKTIERIKTMSDEEFDKLMEREDMDAQTKALAWRIRMTETKKE